MAVSLLALVVLRSYTSQTKASSVWVRRAVDSLVSSKGSKEGRGTVYSVG
jgi:hypothetical protein